MFLLGGAMMLVAGTATLTGWMWHHAPAFGGRGDPSGVVGIYLMGVFAGAATACCAPVLAGAVAIAGISGSWWVGALLGVFYLLGLVSPLLLSALGIGRLRRHLRDPMVVLRLAGRRIDTTLTRLAGGVMCIVLGALLIALALSGNARNAPTFQRTFGRWLTVWATDITNAVPTGIGWLLMLGLVVGLGYLVVRSLRRARLATDTDSDSTPLPPDCCSRRPSEPEGSDLEGVTS